MFVDDVDDVEELKFLLDEAVQVLIFARSGKFMPDHGVVPDLEQAVWDVEDIKARIAQLDGRGK